MAGETKRGDNFEAESALLLLASSVAQIYERQLLEAGTLSSEDAASFKSSLFAKLDEALIAAEPNSFDVPEVKRERGWDKMTWPSEDQWQEQVQTGVKEDVLKEVGLRSVEIDKSVVSDISRSR